MRDAPSEVWPGRAWGVRLLSLVQQLLGRILGNEALTRGLGDPEARMLIEWLVGHAEWLAEHASSAVVADLALQRLCARARAIGRFVSLWCHADARGAACQLAAVERFYWPLPCGTLDPCELMGDILQWESEHERTWHRPALAA